jgi:hypothetical protein
MIWVGAGIIVHGLEVYGAHSVGQAIHSAVEAAAHSLPSAAGPAKWAVIAFLSGVFGVLVGAVSVPVIGFAVAPVWQLVKESFYKSEG